VLLPRSSSRDQFERRTPFDVLDDPARTALEIFIGVDRKRCIDDRRAVGNHDQDREAMTIAIPIISTDGRKFKEFGYFMRPGAAGIRWVVV